MSKDPRQTAAFRSGSILIAQHQESHFQCWTGRGNKIRLKNLVDDKGDELALCRWNKHGLGPLVFRDCVVGDEALLEEDG